MNCPAGERRSAPRAAACLSTLRAGVCLLAASPAACEALAAPQTNASATCKVSLIATPARVWVGQQVELSIRISARHDVEEVKWIEAPSFPDFRAERLPGRSRGTTAAQGEPLWWEREERFALFAARAGHFEIGGASLRCLSASPSGEAATGPSLALPYVRLTLPRINVVVEPPPTAGRPDGYAGALGPLSLELRALPVHSALGESVRVSVSVRGESDLWSLPSPTELATWSEALELFEKPSEVKVERGERLYLRRVDQLDVVARSTGSFEIPALRIPYFDVQTGHYGEARSEALELVVGPRPAQSRGEKAASDGGGVGFDERGVAPSDFSVPPGRSGGFMRRGELHWLAAALLGLSIFALWRRWRRRAPWREVERAFARAEEERGGGPAREAAALAAALRMALEALNPVLPKASSESQRVRHRQATLAAARELRKELDAARFSPHPAHPSYSAVRDLLQQLRALRH